MRWRRWLPLLCLLVGGGLWTAQETGQICLRAFDDRNENGRLDDGEPPMMQGVGMNLLNGRGVTIASKRLDDSPSAARGLACFDDLPAGDYAVMLTSVDATAITSSAFDAAVAPGEAPFRFDFGLKPLTSRSDAAPPLALSAASGLVFGLIASLMVGGLMLIIGLLIYAAVFRPRLLAARAPLSNQPPKSKTRAQ